MKTEIKIPVRAYAVKLKDERTGEKKKRMENLIILAVVAVILALSGRYLYRAKKRGARCIGCPSGCSCSGKCGGCQCAESEESASIQ